MYIMLLRICSISNIVKEIGDFSEKLTYCQSILRPGTIRCLAVCKIVSIMKQNIDIRKNEHVNYDLSHPLNVLHINLSFLLTNKPVIFVKSPLHVKLHTAKILQQSTRMTA